MGQSVLMRVEQLTDIARIVGTPVYVYDAPMIRARYAELVAALRPRVAFHLHYSVKANSNLAVLALLRELGAGADIVSGGELARVRVAGFSPADIVFSGVGKTSAELEAAVRADVGLINVESAGEVELLACIAERLGRRARTGVRVNPDVTTATHPYTQTGEKGMKFGVPLDEAFEVALRIHALPTLRLTSLGMHIGSQIVSAEPYRTGAAKLEQLVRAVRDRGVTSLESVDVGGGLGIPYGPDREGLSPVSFAEAIAPLHRACGLPVLVEPGRFLVGNAGVLLTRVLYRKRSGGRELVITDAGMNDLLRPSLYQARHPVSVVGPAAAGAPGPVDVVGPICETGDFLALHETLPPVEPGALLAIGATGAYGFSMGSQYNSRPRPAEVLIDGERWGIVRDRERVEDLLRGERMGPEWRT